MLDLTAAARAAGVTPATLRRWVHAGHLTPATTKPLRFRLADVESAQIHAYAARNGTIRSLLASR